MLGTKLSMLYTLYRLIFTIKSIGITSLIVYRRKLRLTAVKQFAKVTQLVSGSRRLRQDSPTVVPKPEYSAVPVWPSVRDPDGGECSMMFSAVHLLKVSFTCQRKKQDQFKWNTKNSLILVFLFIHLFPSSLF